MMSMAPRTSFEIDESSQRMEKRVDVGEARYICSTADGRNVTVKLVKLSFEGTQSSPEEQTTPFGCSFENARYGMNVSTRLNWKGIDPPSGFFLADNLSPAKAAIRLCCKDLL